jgi:hypothetical protein
MHFNVNTIRSMLFPIYVQCTNHIDNMLLEEKSNKRQITFSIILTNIKF